MRLHGWQDYKHSLLNSHTCTIYTPRNLVAYFNIVIITPRMYIVYSTMHFSPLSVYPTPSPFLMVVHTLEVEENENHLRSAFVEARESLSESIIADLADYRHKRVMGLAGIFGDHMLSSEMLLPVCPSVCLCLSVYIVPGALKVERASNSVT